jgi:hypothetical protein
LAVWISILYSRLCWIGSLRLHRKPRAMNSFGSPKPSRSCGRLRIQCRCRLWKAACSVRLVVDRLPDRPNHPIRASSAIQTEPLPE